LTISAGPGKPTAHTATHAVRRWRRTGPPMSDAAAPPDGESPHRRLRRLVGARNGLVVPGAYDALSARVIEDAGHAAIYVTGAGVTNGHLGLPDVGVISLSELSAQVAAMRNVTTVPLIVDADTGFGNPVNVWHTVRVLERAGASAIQLEDQVFPKRCGHFDGKMVIPAEEMVQKVKAAVEARRSDDFLVIARTDAIATSGFEAALERAARYVEAGADLTFVEAPGTREHLERIGRSLPVPQVANIVVGGRTPALPLEELKAFGFAMVLYANVALQAAMLATRRALEELKAAGMCSADSPLLVDFVERQRLVDKSFYDALERRYTPDPASS
jgi:2-methylisocitrate lyase-like PEP mutase family enzyme